MVLGLVACVVAVGLGLLSIRSWKAKATRGRKAGSVARANGFSFSYEDPLGCTSVPFELFRQGDGRGAENVMWGDAPDGAPMRVFDYFFYEEYEDPDRRWGFEPEAKIELANRQYRWFTCCLTEVDAIYPPTTIERRGLLSKALSAIGVRPVQFESEAFNRLYAVTGEDTRFIQHLIDPRMMDLLLGTSGKVRVDLRGRWVLVTLDRDEVPPEHFPALVGFATELRRRVPNVVRSMTTQLPSASLLPPIPGVDEPAETPPGATAPGPTPPGTTPPGTTPPPVAPPAPMPPIAPPPASAPVEAEGRGGWRAPAGWWPEGTS